MKYFLEFELDQSMKNYQRAINISNMGLFFLLVEKTDDDHLRGSVQIINNAKVAKEFNYSLALNNKNTSISYSGEVCFNSQTFNLFKYF